MVVTADRPPRAVLMFRSRMHDSVPAAATIDRFTRRNSSAYWAVVIPAPAVRSVKEVARVVTAHRQTEGAGFVVRRPVPAAGLELVDPFLLIDEMGPVDYSPGEAVGAPDHPHRGFETITYALDGEFEHE